MQQNSLTYGYFATTVFSDLSAFKFHQHPFLNQQTPVELNLYLIPQSTPGNKSNITASEFNNGALSGNVPFLLWNSFSPFLQLVKK